MTNAPIHPRHKDEAAKAMEQVKAEPVELKSCPFCGGEAVLRSVNLPMAADCTDIYISCWNCDVNGPGILFDQDTHHAGNIPALEAEAIAAWNKRATPQPAAVDGLVSALRSIADAPAVHCAREEAAWGMRTIARQALAQIERKPDAE